MPLDGWMRRCGELEAEIERLRAVLERCIAYIEGRVGDPVAIVEQSIRALKDAKQEQPHDEDQSEIDIDYLLKGGL